MNKKKHNKMERFIIQDSQSGCMIESFATFEEAFSTLRGYVKEDIMEMDYTPNFYEIKDTETGKLFDEDGNQK